MAPHVQVLRVPTTQASSSAKESAAVADSTELTPLERRLRALNERHRSYNAARLDSAAQNKIARSAAAAEAARLIDDTEWDASMEVIPDSALPDLSPIMALSRAAVADAPHGPPSSHVHWAGIGDAATSALPALPQRKAHADALDWRTFLNMRRPELWFPLARLHPRRIIVHAGPTNSGKTHRALERLAAAESGVYCGPLRLLAWEVHERLSARGVPCDLTTGQEVISGGAGAKHTACTVEMARFDTPVDVAVLDEGQLLGDPDRGFAWTNAFLGLPARELHICGDASALEWIQATAARLGDSVEVHRYERLAPLEVEASPVEGGARGVRKGDAVVVFRRDLVYSMRERIQRETGLRCAIVYGSLPPAVRRLQAAAFNGDGADVLVATDAVGMGLNLNIGRVIFSATVKFDGNEFRPLRTTEVLQIGGRAGRFGSDFTGVGRVAALNGQDQADFIKHHMAQAPPQLERAQLAPTTGHLLAFCHTFPHLPLSTYLHNLTGRATLDSDAYELGSLEAILAIAEVIDEIPLTPYHRVTLCYAPAALDKYPSQRQLVEWYARQLAADAGPISIPSTTYTARPGVPADAAAVERLEETFSNLDLYVWLAQRFGPTVMPYADAARRDRDLIAGLIHEGLEAMGGRGGGKSAAEVAAAVAEKEKLRVAAAAEATAAAEAAAAAAAEVAAQAAAAEAAADTEAAAATEADADTEAAKTTESAATPEARNRSRAAAQRAALGIAVAPPAAAPAARRMKMPQVASPELAAIMEELFAPRVPLTSKPAAGGAHSKEAGASAGRRRYESIDDVYGDMDAHGIGAEEPAPV